MAEKKKVSPMKWIILVVLVVVLTGGGYVGWVKFMNKEPAAVAAPPVAQSVKHDMGTFLVNLSDPSGKRYLKVSIQLEVSSPSVSAEIADHNIEIRDMILMLLSGKEYGDIGNVAGKMMLKQDILSRLNKTLSNGQVKEVYFTEFLVQ